MKRLLLDEDRCVDCDSHISEYHNTPCVYDPDFEPTHWEWCDECNEYHDEENKKMSIVYCGDCLTDIKDCAHGYYLRRETNITK